MNDGLIREVALHFGLGASARSLIDGFLREVDWPVFLATWRRHGYGLQVASWLGDGPNEPVTPEALEEVLGFEALQALADRVGLNARTCAEALAFAVPSLVPRATFEEPRVTPIARTPPTTTGPIYAAWGGPVALAGILLLVSWHATRRSAAPVQIKPVVASASANRPNQLALSTFHAIQGRHGLEYSAVVRDKREKDRLINHLPQDAAGDVQIDLGVSPSHWFEQVNELVRDMPRGLELTISGNQVVLDGLTDDKLAEEVEIRKDRVAGLNIVTQNQIATVQDNVDASSVFASMKQPSLSEWIEATKLIVITFRSGGTKLSADSEAVLTQAAAALLRCNSNETILIAGHTDSTGSAESNRRLSQRRAEEVQEFFIRCGVDRDRLTAQGFGPDDPIASNDTALGRAKNRRIEFKVN